jgi:hypothetical protein
MAAVEVGMEEEEVVVVVVVVVVAAAEVVAAAPVRGARRSRAPSPRRSARWRSSTR